MKTPFPIFRFLSVAPIILMGAPDWVDARGFRGGGGGGRGGHSVSRSAPRAAPRSSLSTSSHTTSRPDTAHQPVNRTPALTPRPNASRVTAPAARPRPTNPKVQPLFNGTPAVRTAAGRTRMNTAMRRNPATVPRFQNTQLQATRVNNRNNWGNAVRTRSVPVRRGVNNTAWVNARINRFPQRYCWHRPHPSTWWWRSLAWAGVGSWIAYDWDDPFYYDYGYNAHQGGLSGPGSFHR